MSVLKRMLSVFAAAAMAASLFGCSKTENTSDSSVKEESSASEPDESSESAEESEVPEEPATVQKDIPLEYDGTDVNDNCADTINKYFTAIINQDYDSYKECLDPYYFDVYNTWLDGNYGYGMETSFETMHQNLMDSAVTANNGNDVKDVVITKIKLSKTEAAEGEEEGEAVADYLGQYDSTIGEGFSEELKNQCDDVISVTFTMTADCDGTELEILQEMEILMTVSDDEYRILG